MDNLAYKFTDTDLREDPALFNVAYNFLAVYAGEFEFLVHAKAQYLTMHELPLGTVRGVLNCMRTLPNARELLGFYMWSPRPPLMAAPPVMTAPTPSRHLHAVREDSRPARMYMRAIWKAEFFLSIHPQAFMTHLLDPVKSEVVWWPHIGKFEVRPTSYCSAHLSFGVMCLHDGGRQHCKQCTCIKRERT
jgi:hypothetical protein